LRKVLKRGKRTTEMNPMRTTTVRETVSPILPMNTTLRMARVEKKAAFQSNFTSSQNVKRLV
jgi:hypothetical protein